MLTRVTLDQLRRVREAVALLEALAAATVDNPYDVEYFKSRLVGVRDRMTAIINELDQCPEETK